MLRKDMRERIKSSLKELEKLRRELGLSQEQAAEKIGVCHPTYSKWVNGHSIPSIVNFKKICEAFGITEEFLSTPGDKKTAEPGVQIEEVVTKEIKDDKWQWEILRQFHEKYNSTNNQALRTKLINLSVQILLN
jgi:transcriptional regulator with XRE-family HTH domain